MDVTAIVAMVQSIPYVGPFAVLIPPIVLLASVIATMLPAPVPTSNVVYKFFYATVQRCALNKGHAVNLSDPASTGIVGGPGAVNAPMIATSMTPKPTN